MTKGLLFAMFGLLGACMVGEDADDDEGLALAGPNARLTIVQHNVEKKQGPLDTAIAAGKDASAITLQEVCPSMLDELRKLAVRKGWTLSATEVPHAGCNNNTQKPFVVAIWTGGATGEVASVAQLGTTSGVPGQMACVAFPFKRVKTHVCSVKLISTTPGGTDGAAETIRRTQTDSLRAYARANWFGGRDEFGIIAGDFNANPEQKSIDALYAPQIAGNGDFTEYNRQGGSRDGQVTAHAVGDNGPYAKKIDYVFFSTNRAPINGAGVTITPTGSDHDMVISTVAMSKK